MSVLLVWGGVGALLAGCSPDGPNTPGRNLLEIDAWDIAQVGGQRLGHAHTTVRLANESGRPVAKVLQQIQFRLQRFGQETAFEVEYRDTETPGGALIDFELVMKQGTAPMRTSGQVAGSRLELQIESQGRKQTQSIPWPAGAGGLIAPELSFQTRPLKPGESRLIEHLNLDGQVCTTEATAGAEEQVELLGGSCRLLRINTVSRTAPNAQGQRMEIKGSYWVNSAGEVLKTWTAPMDLTTFRVSKEVAEAKTIAARLDFGEATLVPIVRAVPNGHDSKRVRYRVRLDDGDPSTVFAAGPSQEVRRIDEHTAEITVRAVRPSPHAPPAASDRDAPGDDDRRPNNFIQSDDPLIVAQAKEAAGDTADPWKVVVALEEYVHRMMKKTDFSQALATAAEVARSREGDCTEHAVYLAALARARGIPARAAVGLVYMPRAQTFGYHMWTEVFVAGQWIALDGTLAKGGIGGGHLKLIQSPMAGVEAYNVFYPVMQVVGRLKLEVLDGE